MLCDDPTSTKIVSLKTIKRGCYKYREIGTPLVFTCLLCDRYSVVLFFNLYVQGPSVRAFFSRFLVSSMMVLVISKRLYES